MLSLIKSQNLPFFVTQDDCMKPDYVMTNIGNFFGCPHDVIKGNITYITYYGYSPTYKILSTPLINLDSLRFGPTIETKKINFNLFPKLKTLILDKTHIINQNLCNLPNNLKTLIFEGITINKFNSIDKFYVLDNLPVFLEQIIFEYLNVTEEKFKYVPYSSYITNIQFEEEQRRILNRIKKNKVPFNCKIYFCLCWDDKYIEKMLFDK